MYLTRMISRGERPDLTLLRLLPDLRVPTPVDAPVCGSCGLPIDPYTNQDVDWHPHFLPASQPTFVRPLRSVPANLPGALDDDAAISRGVASDRGLPPTQPDTPSLLPELGASEELPASTPADYATSVAAGHAVATHLEALTEAAEALRWPAPDEREV
jgi:hypothetical protein